LRLKVSLLEREAFFFFAGSLSKKKASSRQPEAFRSSLKKLARNFFTFQT